MTNQRIQATGVSPAVRALILSLLTAGTIAPVKAEKLEQARVTKAVNVVNIIPGSSSRVPAKIGNIISGGTALSTGDRSRAELEFSDKSLVRLGSNSLFGFKPGEREIELKQGSLLLQVPKGRGDTKIKSLPITAAITGTTILFECSPAVLDAKGQENKPGIVKLIVMEGSLEWAFNSDPRKKLKMVAGDMVVFPANARAFPKKVKVDLGRIKKTSLLMDGGMGALPDVVAVDREIAAQQQETVDPNNPTSGFPIKDPKPSNTVDRSRAEPPADRVVIPPRPDR